MASKIFMKTANKNDKEAVVEYMEKLKHPLKDEIEALRSIVRNANAKISERIKWNAPSYYYKEDLVTFNLRATHHVHLVFHNKAVVRIHSNLLEGDYVDRRMAYFKTAKEVKDNEKELIRILNQLVKAMDRA